MYNIHTPVMLKEVMSFVLCNSYGQGTNKDINKGRNIVDCTFGYGGYSKYILENSNAFVTAFDQDPFVLKEAKKVQSIYNDRFDFFQDNFVNLDRPDTVYFSKGADAIVMDLGLSSGQIEKNNRGFSFMRNEKLDMRMSNEGATASDAINSLSKDDLANIFFVYGEERKSRQIANKIINKRKIEPILYTQQLVEIILSVKGNSNQKKHPATQVFQALRIYINQELDILETTLKKGCKKLKSGGILVVVSFHSIEDRIVKNFIKEGMSDRILIDAAKGAVGCSEEEKNYNPRARSAKLRVALKL